MLMCLCSGSSNPAVSVLLVLIIYNKYTEKVLYVESTHECAGSIELNNREKTLRHFDKHLLSTLTGKVMIHPAAG